MKLKKQAVRVLLLVLAITGCQAEAQTNEMVSLLQNFETRAAGGAPPSYDEAEPVIERFQNASKKTVTEALPVILRETRSPYVTLRRVAAMALFLITMRPESGTMLSAENATFGSLLIDPDLPTRRITGLALANMRLNSNSTLLTDLRAYLSRQDAVANIGGAVAGLLMSAAPEDAASTDAVVQFMQRKDQTPEGRADVLQSVRVARSHNLYIGRAVASYAEEPNESTRLQAIQTLQAMGKEVVADNQQTLSRIAADNRTSPTVRVAVTKALSANP